MATTDLIVAFSAQVAGFETSLKRVNTRLDELSSSASSASREVNGALSAIEGGFARLGNNLKSIAFAAVATAITTGIARAVVAVDDLNASMTRLRVLTGASKVEVDSLFASFNRLGAQTGQGVNDLANSFTRFFVATEGIGASRAQIEQLVQTLANFARVSGQTPGESSAAITQLAQGLASGRLQGDELKSILENMPPLAQALSRALNVSVGQLRQMGEEGKLTAEVVFPALLRAGESLGSRLESVPLNLRQSFQVALDGMLRAISEIDRAVGASEFFGRLFRSIGAGGQAIGVAISGGAPGLEAQVEGEREIARVANERLDVERRIDQIRGDALAQNRQLTADEQSRIRVLEGRLNILPRVQAGAEAVDRVLRNFALQGGTYDDNLREQEGRIQRQAAATRTLDAVLRQVDDAEKIRAEARERRERAETARIRGVNDARVDSVIDGINRQEQAELAALRRREAGPGPRVSNAEGQRANRVTEQLRAFVRQIEGPTQEFERRITTIKDNIQGLFTNPNLGLTQSPLSYVIQGLANDTVRFGQELQRLGQNPLDALAGLQARFEPIRQALLNLPENVRPSLQEIDQIMGQVTDNVNHRLGRLVERAERTFNDIAAEGIKTFTQDLAGGIIDFAATGEQKFDELAANFLKNIAKMILQLLLFRAIAASLGWAGINIPGVTPPVSGTGIAPAPPPAPDFFMDPGGGLSAGSLPTWSPYGMGSGNAPFIEGAMGGRGAGDVTVNVYNNSGSQVRTQEKTDSMGNKMIEVFIEQVVKNGMASGRYDGVMQTSFGASRVGRV